MNLERHPTPRDAAARAADLLGELLGEKAGATLILPAGRTPIPLYEELVRRSAARLVDLSRARIFQLDELVGVGPDDERSFHRFLREHLLDPIGRADDGVRLLDGTARDPEREIADHARALARAGGADMTLLGIGRNGHVAFNEPGSGPDAEARVVDLAPETVASFEGSFPAGRVPTHGITLGLSEIAASGRLVLIATGASKAAAVAALARGKPSPDLPATQLLGHPSFHVLVDEAASRLLDAP